MAKLEGGDLGQAESPATTQALKARDRARDELEAAREALQEAKQTRAVTVADAEDMGNATSELAKIIDPSDFKGGQDVAAKYALAAAIVSEAARNNTSAATAEAARAAKNDAKKSATSSEAALMAVQATADIASDPDSAAKAALVSEAVRQVAISAKTASDCAHSAFEAATGVVMAEKTVEELTAALKALEAEVKECMERDRLENKQEMPFTARYVLLYAV